MTGDYLKQPKALERELKYQTELRMELLSKVVDATPQEVLYIGDRLVSIDNKIKDLKDRL